MNIWTFPVPSGMISVVIDLAHNEAGLEALLEIMNGIRRPTAACCWVSVPPVTAAMTFSSRLGEIAALGADVVEISPQGEVLAGTQHG